MAWDKGFNFRKTSAYVADGADETYVLGDSEGDYPITRNGVTFGWGESTDVGSDDRNSGIDRRLAGINYTIQTTKVCPFLVDLPSSGDYTIRLAEGDYGSAQGNQWVEFFDNTTSLFTVNNTAVAQATYYDATNTNYSTANWPGNNTAVQKTFATTTFKMVIGKATGTGYTVIAHLFISQVAGGGFVPYPLGEERGARGGLKVLSGGLQ